MEEEEGLVIPRSALELLTHAGYFDRYRHYLGIGLSARCAWQATEDKLMEIFNIHRHEDYDSFRVGLSRERRVKRLKLQNATYIK